MLDKLMKFPVYYDEQEHYQDIFNWYTKHDQVPPTPGMLPPTGLVVPGFAACFLYQTNSSIAMIEGLISNPDSDKDERSAAIDAILIGLTKMAKTCGHKHVIGFTECSKTLGRLLKLGYVERGSYHFIRKEV